MKKYLAVFVAPLEAYDAMRAEMKNKSEEQKKQEMQAWMDWMQTNKDKIADHGGGVGMAKRVTEGGNVTDTRNEIGGYMIIQAESSDEAAGIFKNSPHFGVTGGAVEVMEIMQM